MRGIKRGGEGRGSPADGRRESGVLLVECLVYVGVSALVLGLAFAAFYRVWENSVALRRMSEGTVRFLRAGEGWREDVRVASGPLRMSGGDGVGGTRLVIPQGGTEVVYEFGGGRVFRSTAGGPRREVMSGVKAFRVVEERRREVRVWRWEVELAGARRAKVRPLFTVVAVQPGTGGGR